MEEKGGKEGAPMEEGRRVNEREGGREGGKERMKEEMRGKKERKRRVESDWRV